MSYYRGKRALVTGGSEGIGLAVAAGLQAHGARVTIASRRQSKLDKAVRKHPGLEAHALDLTDAPAVQTFVDAQQPYELVVNCVGFAKPGYLLEQSLEDIYAMMNGNCYTAINLTKALLPSWTRRASGHLVHTSSIGGFLGLFGYTGYCASKFALLGFCEALQRELKPYKIAVSVLCPPNTRTPGLDEENKTKPPEVLATEEKIIVVEPETVAQYLLKVMPRRPFLVIPTSDGRWAHRLKRWTPAILDSMLKRPEPGQRS